MIIRAQNLPRFSIKLKRKGKATSIPDAAGHNTGKCNHHIRN